MHSQAPTINSQTLNHALAAQWLKFGLLILSLFASSSSLAADLCNPYCEISISFPEGGSLQALEGPVILKFDDSGLLDTGLASTAYSQGETYTINSGEQLDFSNGGQVVLGPQGNIDFTHIIVESSGEFRIKTETDATEITIADGQVLEINADFSLIIESGTLTLADTLNIGSGSSLVLGEGNDGSSGSGLTLSVPDSHSDGVNLSFGDAPSVVISQSSSFDIPVLKVSSSDFIVYTGDLVGEVGGFTLNTNDQNPTIIDIGKLTFLPTEESETPTPESSGESGSAGSLDWGWGLLLGLFLGWRKTSAAQRLF